MRATADPGDSLETAYRTFLAGDPAALRELLSEDVVYHLPGLHLGGGVLNGRTSIVERLASAAGALDAPPRVELLHVASAGGLVVTLERFHGETPNDVLDQHACVVWRFVAGRCVEIWSHFEDQRACDAFWRSVTM